MARAELSITSTQHHPGREDTTEPHIPSQQDDRQRHHRAGHAEFPYVPNQLQLLCPSSSSPLVYPEGLCLGAVGGDGAGSCKLPLRYKEYKEIVSSCARGGLDGTLGRTFSWKGW